MRLLNNMYIITWTNENVSHFEHHVSLVDAIDRLIKLEQQGILATIHMKSEKLIMDLKHD